jgi:hypothetical protein
VRLGHGTRIVLPRSEVREGAGGALECDPHGLLLKGDNEKALSMVERAWEQSVR